MKRKENFLPDRRLLRIHDLVKKYEQDDTFIAEVEFWDGKIKTYRLSEIVDLDLRESLYRLFTTDLFSKETGPCDDQEREDAFLTDRILFAVCREVMKKHGLGEIGEEPVDQYKSVQVIDKETRRQWMGSARVATYYIPLGQREDKRLYNV